MVLAGMGTATIVGGDIAARLGAGAIGSQVATSGGFLLATAGAVAGWLGVRALFGD